MVPVCYLENTTEVDFTYILLGVLQNFRYLLVLLLPLFWDTLGVEIPCIVVHTVELPLTFLLVQIRVEIKNTTGGYENSEVIVKGTDMIWMTKVLFIIHFLSWNSWSPIRCPCWWQLWHLYFSYRKTDTRIQSVWMLAFQIHQLEFLKYILDEQWTIILSLLIWAI